MTEPRPYPGLLAALLLTLLAWSAVPLVAALALNWATPTAALGIGVTFGLGGVALLGAQRVPPPQAERLGLRGVERSHLLPLLLLVPTVLLASEVDNCVQALLPAPDATELAEQMRERLPTRSPLALIETLVVAAGLAPIAEEWLFRGVLQQGLVARLGAPGGIVATAALFALGHGSLGISGAAWLALTSAAFGSGIALGFLRHASGSLVAAILLHAALNGTSVLALALADRVPVPGFNVPGSHTPPGLLIPAALSVGLGILLLARRATPTPRAPNGREAG